MEGVLDFGLLRVHFQRVKWNLGHLQLLHHVKVVHQQTLGLGRVEVDKADRQILPFGCRVSEIVKVNRPRKTYRSLRFLERDSSKGTDPLLACASHPTSR